MKKIRLFGISNRSLRIFRTIGMLLTVGILMSSVVVSAQEPDPPIAPVPGVEGLIQVEDIRIPKGTNPKLDSSINQLVDMHNKTGLAGTQSFAKAHGLVLDGEKAQVVIVSTPQAIESLTAAIERFGGESQAYYDGNLQALVPIDSIETLTKRWDVQRIREPRRPSTQTPMQAVGTVSEGLAASNASAWYSAGYDGTGVRVAVIDIGFTGYSALLGSELPSSVGTYDWTGTGMGSNDHGTACSEIVYDIAPGITMDLHKVSTGVELGQAVTQAISDGAAIISMSLFWWIDGPGDGTGFLASIVADARSNGIFFAIAAGNSAEVSWSGTYVNYNDYHAWDGGSQQLNWIGPGGGFCWYISDGTLLRAGLHWDDWTYVNQDYDLRLIRWDADVDEYYSEASSTAWQNGGEGQTPEEFVGYVTTATGNQCYAWAVERYDSNRNVCLRLHAAKNWHLDQWTPARSITFPADSPDAIAVGAVDVNSPYPLESYSSHGPTFGSGGSCSGGSTKPDISAYANVSTTYYPGFNGTSAATPHVAGAAALVKQFFPSYNVNQLQNYLESQSLDLGVTGMDNLYGWGRLFLPNIINIHFPLILKN